jgi:hypothetical protein
VSSQWQWRDGSGGGPHLQRVANAAVYTASQKAYRAYIEHAAACPACGETKCQQADELWQAYQAARGEGTR